MKNTIVILFMLMIVGLLSRKYIGRVKNFKGKAVSGSETLGTDGDDNNVFHKLLTTPSELSCDGIILAFEKIKRQKVVRQEQGKEYSVADQYRLFGIDQSLKEMDKHGFGGRAKRLVNATLNDPKPLLLTHWVEYRNGRSEIGYSAYNTLGKEKYNLASSMMEQYEALAKRIANRISQGGFTHLLIMSTGWENDQITSLDTYNRWIASTAAAAESDGASEMFVPYVVGITWPSKWATPVASVFNKANDADELGITHLNYFLWKELLPEMYSVNPKIPVITIGHSFGARILSRASHSSFLFDKFPSAAMIDLSIDFQGAYPITRFFEKRGSNGGLYTVDNRVKLHVLTTSQFDTALSTAFWSVGYAGSRKARRRMERPTSGFGICLTNAAGEPENFQNGWKKVMVNADNFINSPRRLPSGAHADVRDAEAGKFIWELLKKCKV
jgi:hypothetical protein